MRVLAVVNYYSPYVSGLTESARMIAEGAAAAGCDVTVLAGRHSPSLPLRENLNGVSVVRAEPQFFLHKGYISFDLFRRFRELVRAADVVHLHLPMLESAVIAKLVPRRKPLIACYHCDVVPSGAGSLIDKLAVGAVRRSCRAALRHCSRIAVSSFDYARGSSVLQPFRKNWVEIYPPDKGPRTLPPRADLGSAPRVGFLGRFVEEKGIGVLLDAAEIVLRSMPAVKFVLAGNYSGVAGGSQYERLRARIERLGASVECPGHIAENELHAFYASLDLFVLPSISSYEAFGMVQIEAMKSGVPVIASDLRGVRIPVGKTGCGKVVPPGQPAPLADAILSHLSLANRPSREEIAARAHKAFSPQWVTDQYVRIYREAVDSTKVPR